MSVIPGALGRPRPHHIFLQEVFVDFPRRNMKPQSKLLWHEANANM